MGPRNFIFTGYAKHTFWSIYLEKLMIFGEIFDTKLATFWKEKDTENYILFGKSGQLRVNYFTKNREFLDVDRSKSVPVLPCTNEIF